MDCWNCLANFISVLIFHVNIISSEESTMDRKVFITSSSNIKYIRVPTSDDPVLTWMEVKRGFPNITINDSSLVMNVTIGEPITLFIFFKDNSNLYNIKVTDCWAYDEKSIYLSRHRLHLFGNNFKSEKMLTEWKKGNFEDIPNFIYTSFTAFKFPDKDYVYLICDVELIGKDKSRKNSW